LGESYRVFQKVDSRKETAVSNNKSQINSSASLPNLQTDHLNWLWLAIGFVLLPFTTIQTIVPLTAWLAPTFLLRFVRTSRRARIALLLVFVAYALGIFIALRGSATNDIAVYIFGIITFPLIRGLMYTLPYAADRLISSRLGPWERVFVFPLAFTSVDWLMSLSRIINSTGSPAYSQYGSLALMQILSITGMWGITFLLMWFASTVNALWEHGFEPRPVRGLVGVFAGVLMGVLLFGSVRLNFFPPSSGSVEAATITLDDAISQQAGSGIDWLKFNQSSDAERAAARPQFEATIDQLLARTETALRGGAKIVAWQEGAGTILEEDKQTTLDRVAALAREYDADLEVSLGVLTRTTAQQFILNQSILVDHTGAVRWTYEKTYLVIPVESYIAVPGDGKLPVVDTAAGRLSTAICNDLHFPMLIWQAGANNVDILIAPYNDVIPFGQGDAVTAIFRAIENGVSLLRPAGHGTSMIVDYEGRILASQNYFTNNSGIMMTAIPIRGVTTIYSRIGDVFAYLCVAGFIFLTSWAFIRRRQPALIVHPQHP
jgi:apolipoprotein N-acyltransferase